MALKKERPAGQQGQSLNTVKDTTIARTGKKRIKYTDTQRDAYYSIEQLRGTERNRARVFFHEHPNGQYSRADLCEALKLPVNHITRVVSDLLDAGHIEVSGKRISPHSGKTVQVLRLKRKEAAHE